MIDVEQLQAQAVAAGHNRPDWIAYTMVEKKPYPLGFMAWAQSRWDEVRAMTGLDTVAMPVLSGEIFGGIYLEKCASAVRSHYGFSP